MHIKLILWLSIGFLFGACSGEKAPKAVSNDQEKAKKGPESLTKSKQQPTIRSPRIKEKWRIEGLNEPESVVFDENSELIYISNVHGTPLEKNQKGYITQADNHGKILKKQWLTGLNAPKGMAIQGESLWLTDIDKLLQVNLSNAQIENTYHLKKAKFLNDVVLAPDGTIYVSDMFENTLYRLKEGKLSPWLQDDLLDYPNGLWLSGDQLLVAAWGVITDPKTYAAKVPGRVLSVGIKDRKIKHFPGMLRGNLDGLVEYNTGEYFVSDWLAGKVYFLNSKGEHALILDGNAGSADIHYNYDYALLFVPIMGGNTLVAYSVYQ